MFARWFGRKNSNSRVEITQEQLDPLISELASRLPDAPWIALVSQNGLIQAQTAGLSPAFKDIVSAMGAAIWSLGERTTRELESGRLLYSVTAGDLGLHIAFLLPDRTHMVFIEARHDASVDGIVHVVREATTALVAPDTTHPDHTNGAQEVASSDD